jgi:hypothetical protein
VTDRPRIPSLFRAVLVALFLQLAATVYAVASLID